MKLRIQSCMCLLALALASAARAQGSFQNLGFEAAHDLPTQNGFVPASNAMPGWTVLLGTNQFPDVFCSGVSAGSALVSLIGRNTSGWSNSVISGNYTAVLVAGVDLSYPHDSLFSAAISQTSLVPVSSQSLRFRLGSYSSASDFLVTFNGQTVPFFPLATGPNYTTYGGDISAFAATTGELRFTERPISRFFTVAYLDGIQFSPEAIPEPPAFRLISFLALGFCIQRFRRRLAVPGQAVERASTRRQGGSSRTHFVSLMTAIFADAAFASTTSARNFHSAFGSITPT